MKPLRRWSPANVTALALVASAASVLAVVAYDAWRLDAPPAARATGAAAAAALPARADTMLDAAFDAVVAHDAFRADRAPAAERFRLPGEAADAPAPYLAVAAPVPAMRVEGIVARAGGGMAALALPGRPARLVLRGQAFEQFVLTHVTADAVTLSSPDTTIVLRLVRPGAVAVAQ